MDIETVLSVVWNALNSPIGVSLVASAALWVINKLYTAKPAWQAYEGAIIKAVQWAEREIPDDSENKYIRRANSALQYVLKAYERINGKCADAYMTAQLEQGIEVVHTDLEAAGVL
jgi:hypothetical protein